MLKGLFTLNLLFLLALSPVALAYAGSDGTPLQARPDSAFLEIACEQVSSGECADDDRCLVLGHSGCHLSPFQPTAVGGFAWQNKAAYLPAHDVPKLPLYETFPPLRPPKRS